MRRKRPCWAAPSAHVRAVKQAFSHWRRVLCAACGWQFAVGLVSWLVKVFYFIHTDGTLAASAPFPRKYPPPSFRRHILPLLTRFIASPVKDSFGGVSWSQPARPALPLASWRAARLITSVFGRIQLSKNSRGGVKTPLFLFLAIWSGWRTF